jgi:hypothetical protein
MGKKEKGVKSKLKPCKYCDNAHPQFRYAEPAIDFLSFDLIMKQKCWITCEECGYSTRRHKNEYKALIEWNSEVNRYE